MIDLNLTELVLFPIVLPIVVWAIWMTVYIKNLGATMKEFKEKDIVESKADHLKILTILNDAENSGFGTKLINAIIRDNTLAIRELTHYLQWSIKAQTGKEAPPAIGGAQNDDNK